MLALGVVANLGREATSRLTGHEPAAVLALVQQGQERLAMSVEDLIGALRAPARPAEVTDLPLVTPLFTAALTRPAPQAATAAAPLGKGAAWAEAFEASLAAPAPVEPLGIASLAQAPSSAFHLTAVGSATGTPSRPAKAGVAATVWLVALGGVGTAAAMSGLLTAAVDGILGDQGKPPLVIAEGPVFPGTPATPSTGDGSTTGNPQAQPGDGSGTGGRAQPGTSQAAERPGTGGTVAQPASLTRGSTVTQIVLASFEVPAPSTPATPVGTPSTPTAPTTPATPSGPQTIAPPPASGPVTVGNGSTQGADKASTRAAKAAAKAAARAARAAAKADRRAAKHHGKPQAKDHAKSAKAAKAKAAKAAKAKAAKAQSSEGESSQGQGSKGEGRQVPRSPQGHHGLGRRQPRPRQARGSSPDWPRRAQDWRRLLRSATSMASASSGVGAVPPSRVGSRCRSASGQVG